MAVIRAPFSAPPNVLGIGRHRLEFHDGECPDPGLNDGEVAYLRGRGYVFVDEPKRAPAKAKRAPAKAKTPDVETPDVETAPAE